MPQEITPLNNCPLTQPIFQNFDTLNGFFQEIEGLFTDIVFHWDQALIPKKYRNRLQQAWLEVLPKLKDIITNNRIIGLAWEDVGLVRNQLALKLEILVDAWKNFNKNGSPKQLKAVLKIINLILGSISAKMESAEPIKGIGEFIEGLIGGDFEGLDRFFKNL